MSDIVSESTRCGAGTETPYSMCSLRLDAGQWAVSSHEMVLVAAPTKPSDTGYVVLMGFDWGRRRWCSESLPSAPHLNMFM